MAAPSTSASDRREGLHTSPKQDGMSSEKEAFSGPFWKTGSALQPLDGRLLSLDVFRGVTIAGMILVNNPGSWSHVYPPLQHAEWHGWTPTDLIFPFFLFIVGVAIPLAYTKRLARRVPRKELVGKALKRSGLLFAVGLFMAAYPVVQFDPTFEWVRPGLGELRIMGILQRIALCYLAATLLFLYVRFRWQLYVMGGLLLGYWAALTLVPVPGYGAGMLDTPEATLPAYVDRLLLGTEHLWQGADQMWDPEGLLSTLPAIGTTLLGVWVGRLLLNDEASAITIAKLFVFGTGLVITGAAWDSVFPINKSLWTSSYVLFTGGWATCAFALCYWFADLRDSHWWTQPFVVYGINPLTAFVLSTLLTKTFLEIPVVGTRGEAASPHAVLYETLFLSWASPTNASLLYAVAYVILWYGILLGMYRNGLVIKV
ncbi:MAG: acyltransferase family protein [Salinivenus sp.]